MHKKQYPCQTNLVTGLEDIAIKDFASDLTDFKCQVAFVEAVRVVHNLRDRVKRVSLHHFLKWISF